MVNAIGGFNNNINNLAQLNDVAKQAISLATDLHGTAGMLKSVGSLFENLGKLVGGSTGSTNVAQQSPLSSKLGDLLNQLTGLLGGLGQMLAGLQGGAQQAGGGAQAGGAQGTQK